MISVKNLSKQVGSFSLKNINLTIEDGESFVLLGPSGAGKTLLIESIMGLKKPDTGKVLLDNKDITKLPPEKRKISYVPQDLGLFPHLTVKQNILFGPTVQKNMTKTQTNNSLEKLIALLNLQTFINRKNISLLSGGEKQRVALARALIVKPRALFLDEPFASLDQMLKRELQIQFRSLQKALKINFVYVTHDQDEPYILGDKMGIIINGNLIQTGPTETVYNQPATTQIAKFLLMQNLFKATNPNPNHTTKQTTYTLQNNQNIITTNKNQIQNQSSTTLGIWPKHVILTNHHPTNNPNTYNAKITNIIKYRSHYLIQTLLTNNPQIPTDENNIEMFALINDETHSVIQPKTNQQINLHLPPDSIITIPC